MVYIVIVDTQSIKTILRNYFIYAHVYNTGKTHDEIELVGVN